jgi:hypothetical protein
MANLEGFKKVSGPTIIGGGTTTIGGAPKSSVISTVRSSTHSTDIAKPSSVISEPLAQPVKKEESTYVQAAITTAPNELKLPPKPVVEEQKSKPNEQPVVIEKTTSEYFNPLSEQVYEKQANPKESFNEVFTNARNIFLKEPKAQAATQASPLIAPVVPNTQIQQFGVSTLAENQKKSGSFGFGKTSKVYRVPVYFAVVALITAIFATATIYFVNKQTGSQSQAATVSASSDVTTQSIKAITYLAKNSLDENKKSQTEFKKGDPIQICIDFAEQVSTSQIEIKINRGVDDGSQQEILSTKFNAAGTDVRCLPFVGSLAVAGKYTVLLNNSIEAVENFKKVADTKFVITEAPTLVQ